MPQSVRLGTTAARERGSLQVFKPSAAAPTQKEAVNSLIQVRVRVVPTL
jgi:hypothetical protein